MGHEALDGTYYFIIAANGKSIGVLSVAEGERVAEELARPIEPEALLNQFIQVTTVYGNTMTINRTFLGYVALSSPESRQVSQEWHDATAPKKEAWEK